MAKQPDLVSSESHCLTRTPLPGNVMAAVEHQHWVATQSAFFGVLKGEFRGNYWVFFSEIYAVSARYHKVHCIKISDQKTQ